jgi:hypothetical protein
MTEFVRWLSTKYGGGHSEGYQRARNRVFTTVKSRHTIIVDNAQAMYRQDKGTQQPVFNFLRRLQDEQRCTVILSITPEFNSKLQDRLLMGYFEQFEGRAGGRRNFLVLPEYPPEEDVRDIAKAFGLREVERHLEYLTRIGQEPGRVRRLFEDLQDAKRLAESQKKPFTIGHVKEVRGED